MWFANAPTNARLPFSKSKRHSSSEIRSPAFTFFAIDCNDLSGVDAIQISMEEDINQVFCKVIKVHWLNNNIGVKLL